MLVKTAAFHSSFPEALLLIDRHQNLQVSPFVGGVISGAGAEETSSYMSISMQLLSR